MKTMKQVRKLPNLVIFLLAFFLYSDGTSTIGAAVAVFATQELQMTTPEVLILLLEAILFYGLGAAIMIRLKHKYRLNAKYIIMTNLFLFGLVPLYALVALTEKIEMYMLAIVYGLNFGSLTSLSRSEFTDLIPLGHESEFFSLLQITDKGTAWYVELPSIHVHVYCRLGPLVLSIVATATGSFRSAFGCLIAFFYGGLAIFVFYDPKKADEERHAFEAKELAQGTFLLEQAA